MARRSILNEEDVPVIELSSMIDCIFILLIFFIVTTVFVEEKGLQVSKPDAAAASLDQESDNLVLTITAQNELLLDGRPIGLADVTARVKARLGEPDTPVTIRVSEKSHHGTFVAVWDAVKRGGAAAVSFSTVQ